MYFISNPKHLFYFELLFWTDYPLLSFLPIFSSDLFNFQYFTDLRVFISKQRHLFWKVQVTSNRRIQRSWKIRESLYHEEDVNAFIVTLPRSFLQNFNCKSVHLRGNISFEEKLIKYWKIYVIDIR